MASTDVIALTDEDGTEVFAVDQSGNADFAGGITATTTLTATTDLVAARLLSDQVVIAEVTAVGGSGGATAGTISVQLTRTDETTDATSARQVLIVCSETQYAPFSVAPSDTVTFGTATAGTKVASGTGWALVETTAAGLYEGATANSADETVYFRVITAEGASDPTDCAVVAASNEASATWAA